MNGAKCIELYATWMFENRISSSSELHWFNILKANDNYTNEVFTKLTLTFGTLYWNLLND